MQHQSNFARGVTLLTISGLFCLSIGAAQCQRGGRQSNRAAAGQATTSASQMASCPTGSASSTGTTTTTGSTTTTGTTGSTSTVTANAASRIALYNQLMAQRSAQTGGSASGALSAQRAASNQLLVQWSGNTANVQGVYLGLLDANGQVIAQRSVTQMPAQAGFTLTSSARYYAARVVYSNGTSNMLYTPIR